MAIEDTSYGFKYFISWEMVSRYPFPFKQLWQDRILPEFTRKFAEQILEPMIGDGMNHVLKTDLLRTDDENGVTIYLKCDHCVARFKDVVIKRLVWEEDIPVMAVKVCRWCGSVLKLDARGGCTACGAPAGKSFQ